jgi:hypothetical protein
MAELPLHQLSDGALEDALRGLGDAVDWPAARPAAEAPDVATRVRARIVAGPPIRDRRRASWLPLRRALVLAVIALLVLVTVAAAVAFGVPGIRLVLGVPPGTPPPTVAPGTSPSEPPGLPGSSLDLGEAVAPGEIEGRVPFPVRLPTDPAVGEPDAVYVTPRGEVTLIWAPSGALPATTDAGIGLLLMEFRGSVEPDAITKIIGSGTTVESVTVGDARGYWITGDPHFYFYETPEGEHVENTRRWVGDALIWADGDVTYRLETSLGRDAAIRIAESLE